MKEIVKKVQTFCVRLKDDHISESAAECAYYTILSFVPFIIFFITLIQYTIIDKQIVLDLLKEVLPISMQAFVFGIIDEVYSRTINTVSISLLVALWSASKGFYALCKGLKNIYKVSENRPNFVIRIEGFIYTLLFIVSVIAVMILIVFGNRIHNFVVQNFFSWGIITALFLKIRTITAIVLLFFVFIILYKFIPSHKMNFKSQILGAAFSSIALTVTSYVFSIYIDVFKGFSNTYGSLTSIILIMMWIYSCMYIILLGAEINSFVMEYKIMKRNKENIKIKY